MSQTEDNADTRARARQLVYALKRARDAIGETANPLRKSQPMTCGRYQAAMNHGRPVR